MSVNILGGPKSECTPPPLIHGPSLRMCKQFRQNQLPIHSQAAASQAREPDSPPGFRRLRLRQSECDELSWILTVAHC
jgi:hypothetical protein